MKFPFFHIDAFTSNIFAGNPAGVCFLDEMLDERLLQAIAAENNLSETAFLAPAGDGYELRWFSPSMEIDLCGHATLASAHAVFEYIDPDARQVLFSTKSGDLSVVRKDNLLIMNFPSRHPEPCEAPEGIAEILGAAPRETLKARDLMVIFDNEEQIRDMTPDIRAIEELDYFAVIVTATGRKSDFVSRFFAPRAGVSEDPVTGSAHSTLIPYWSEILGKKELYALQLSERGGELFCADLDGRVAIGGHAVTFLSGTIDIEP